MSEPAWIEGLKCWNPACRAPLAAVPRRQGWLTTKCRICGEEVISWVAPEKTPHGGEGWSVTPHETVIAGAAASAREKTP